jgi:hypothetical protein
MCNCDAHHDGEGARKSIAMKELTERRELEYAHTMLRATLFAHSRETAHRCVAFAHLTVNWCRP